MKDLLPGAAVNLQPAAGECLRKPLEAMMQLIGNGDINLEKCGEISDNFTQVILRFFEGDVPMMICTEDTVSAQGSGKASPRHSPKHLSPILSCRFRCQRPEAIPLTAPPSNFRSTKPAITWR